ncbi:MAG: polyphosphate kinase 2 family protein [Pseudomonadaceae bacterium]|nr:polyphosphate kinase 2 family protein [Pseudomonadaceae bacterium]
MAKPNFLDPDRYRFRKGDSLKDHSTHIDHDLDKSELKSLLAVERETLIELQEKMYANDAHSLLLIFQGMDSAGKDSTIKHVMSGINPAGFQVHSFGKPTSNELAHNWLWRHWRAMPERGRIGIHNRSHYEEVLILKVHPEFLDSRSIPNLDVDKSFWEKRYDDIKAMEDHLVRSGTRVVKFFLNVSKEEQRQRFLSRLNEPEKFWKWNSADLEERKFWDDYQDAFEDALKATHQTDAPWFVIPADHKWTMRAIVANIVRHQMTEMDPAFPVPNEQQLEYIARDRALLGG